jgi:hypothetical protein
MYAVPFALYPIQPSSATLQNAPGVIVPEWVGGPGGGGGGAALVVGGGAGLPVVLAGAGAGAAAVVAAVVVAAAGVVTVGAGDAGLALPEPSTAAAIALPAQHSTRKAAMTPRMIGSVRLLAGAVRGYGGSGTGAVPAG